MAERRVSIVILLAASTFGCATDERPSADGSTGSSGAASTGSTGMSTSSTATTDGTSTSSTASTVGPTDDTGADSTSGGVDVELVSSITQYGITWTFDGEYPAGQFVTGDWWVVGPLNVVEISPAPTSDRNGSMLDPVGAQAYDARAGEYDGSKAVTAPLAIDAEHSLVSSISHPEESECDQGGTPGWQTYDGDCQRGPIHTQAVLTVVAAPPTGLAVRPPYAGANKPIHLVSSICEDALPSLAPPAELPDATALLRHVERPWIDHLGSWTMQHGCATHNMYCYGREIGNIVSVLAAYAILDAPQRDEIATRLVQLGIDNYGVVQAGGGWGSDGGHFNGRKFPIVFAGALLGDAGMSSPGTAIGNEDAMTYDNGSGLALWGRDCDNCYFDNACMYDDNCPNGARDCRDPAETVDGCDDYRNCCTSVTWVGEALAIRLMGMQSAWGHDPFFAYVERWMNGDVPGGGDTSAAFVSELWSTHAATPPHEPSCP
jgi:hypothetical protein